MALTDDGTLFYWVSSDPDLRCQQIYAMCGKNIVSLSAGKYWTAAVTATGDVYMWDGKKGKDKPPVATRLHGVKRATSVSVGETHLLIVASLYHPSYPPSTIENSHRLKLDDRDGVGELGEEILFKDTETNNMISSTQTDNSGRQSVPSLKSLCEEAAAENLVEPRNAIQLLEIADSLGADDLKKYCEEIVIRNLDYIFTVSTHAIASASPDILANLERLLDQKSSEPWNHRHLPTPTATFPVVINSEEDESEIESQRIRDEPNKLCSLEKDQNSFLQPKDDPDQGISKEVRALRKKLQQIEMLELKQSNGCVLDDQQIAKLESKPTLLSSLMKLGVPVETLHKESSSVLSEGKGTKKSKASKKQRRKSSKSSVLQTEAESVYSGTGVIPEAEKDLLGFEILEVSNTKVEADLCEQTTAAQGAKESAFIIRKYDSLEMPVNKGQSPKVSKKKSKKGGLSMFLSGALDDASKEVAPPPPPTPKNEGPAWGGAKFLMGSATLREIQDEQSKIKEIQLARGKDLAENVSDCGSGGKIRLSSFLPSSPIPVASARSSSVSDGEKSTPTWAASGTPPHLSRPSLRDIQMQQGKKQQNISHSPITRTAGFTIATGQGSPSDASGVNRWFRPEVETPSSIRSIQIEEKAMKDLKRFYSSVKIVKSLS